MIAFCLFSFLIALASCQNGQDEGDYYYDYDAPKTPLCPKGKFDKGYIDNYILGKINDYRVALLLGSQFNYQAKEKIPKGKMLTELVWGCGLEKKAKELLKGDCSDNVMPKIPVNRTGFFFKLDIDWAEGNMMTAVRNWTEEIDKNDAKHDKITLRYSRENQQNLRNYLQLMYRLTTKIGCADVLCKKNNVNMYRGLCLTNKPPLKDDQVVMRFGKGGCNNGERCPVGYKCNPKGLCTPPK